MAYPFRMKLVHKQTGETFKEWAKRNKKSDSAEYPTAKFQLMPFINEDGNIGYVDFEGFYLSNSFLSPKDWELHLATEKLDGKWLYKKIGH